MTIKDRLFNQYSVEIDPALYIRRLSETEQNIYNLIEINGLDQKSVAKLEGVTQGAISSRLSRICKKIGYLYQISQFDVSNIDNDLGHIFGPFETELVKGMIGTTCQSETARILNQMFNLMGNKKMNQVKIRHRFEKCLKQLKDNKDPLLIKYYNLLKMTKENLYMLYEVKLPKWERGF